MRDMKRNNPIKDAMDTAGSGPKLAGKLGVSARAIYKWRARWDAGITAAVPPNRAVEIESVTGISRHRLRPDLWPDSESPDQAA